MPFHSTILQSRTLHITISKDRGLKFISSFLIHQDDWNSILPHCRNMKLSISGVSCAVTWWDSHPLKDVGDLILWLCLLHLVQHRISTDLLLGVEYWHYFSIKQKIGFKCSSCPFYYWLTCTFQEKHVMDMSYNVCCIHKS